MRAGETVVVCGARADKSQFVTFEWPKHAVVWVSVGCGNLTFLAPAPDDADSEARANLARAYVDAVWTFETGREAAAGAVESWLVLVERAARVPSTFLFAWGGVRVTAVPIYQATWSARHVTVVCAHFRATRRRRHTVEQDVYDILSKRGVCATPDLEATFRVVKYQEWMHLLPYERCSLCHREIRSSFRDVVPFSEEMRSERVWLPQLLVCATCPLRSFALDGFHFEVRGGRVYATEKREESVRLFCEESVWQARGSVIATLALALASRARPKTAFAASLATALCDLKLLRVVAERMHPPEPKDARPRAVSLLVEKAPKN